MKKTVYLIPAPDMDSRSVEAIQLENYKVVPISLDPIGHDTCLRTYTEKLKLQIQHKHPILIGACYGGALALEVSKVMNVERVVVVACIKNKRELSFRWRVLLRLYCFIPAWVEKALGKSVAFLLNDLLKVKIKVPRLWRKSGQNKFIAQHLLTLKSNAELSRVVHVHGKKDAIFPIKMIPHVDFVIESGHFMINKSRRETLAAISKAIEV